ncbi:MAG: hypothetical protein GQE15_18415 [Archangiaceae bacterium]|nr:hypothetical protein [Archangiaceae bacterium]
MRLVRRAQRPAGLQRRHHPRRHDHVLNRNGEPLWANRKAIALASDADANVVRASSYYNIARIYGAHALPRWLPVPSSHERNVASRFPRR